MVSPSRNDRTLQIHQLAREIQAEDWTDEPTAVTELPRGTPAHVRASLPLILAIPAKHRAPLLLATLLLLVVLLVYLVSAGHAPKWITG